jgi:D-alanyl-D-alanine dipeptidase
VANAARFNIANSRGVQAAAAAPHIRAPPPTALDELADMASSIDQRRQHAHHIVAGRDRQQALGAQIIHEGAAVGLHLDAEHQPEPAHAFEQMVVVGDHLLERRAQPLALLADSARNSSLATTSNTACPAAIASGLPP